MEPNAGSKTAVEAFAAPPLTSPSRSQRPEDAHVEILFGETSRLVAQLTEPTTELDRFGYPRSIAGSSRSAFRSRRLSVDRPISRAKIPIGARSDCR